MATYSLEQLKSVWLPKNTTVSRNNKDDFAHGLNRPNDAVSLLQFVIDAVAYAPSAGVTNLSISNQTGTNLDINSSTGADITVPQATGALAGLLNAVDKAKLTNITVTQSVNLDTIELNLNNLITLTGVSANDINLGTFTGSTIPDNVTIKVALQALENVVGVGYSENGITGNGTSGSKYKLGGTLIENTIINGAYSKYLIVNDTSSITLEADINTPTTTAKSSLFLSSSLLAGALLRSEINNITTRYGEVRLDPDGTLTSFQQVNGTSRSGAYMPSENQIYLENYNGTTSRKITVSNTGHFLENLDLGTTPKIVYIDDTTGELLKGDVPTGGSGSSISKYDAGNGAYVMATGTGVTFAKSSGVGTFTVPVGVILISARINGTTADLNANNFSITIPMAAADDFPSVTKINTITAAGASTGVPYVYDMDNTPQIQCTSSTTTMTVRAINMNAFTNWALKLNF